MITLRELYSLDDALAACIGTKERYYSELAVNVRIIGEDYMSWAQFAH